MSADPIRARVIQVMSAVFGISTSDIGPDASAETMAEWDSVAHLQLMLAIEDTFGVQLGTSELTSLVSLADIVRRLELDDAGV